MSSQKGNISKKGPPKHTNKWGFKNDMNDRSKKIQDINSIIPEGTCEQCKAVIDWKIKYKKYKPLTVPSKCVKCSEKNVKRAYYIVCENCCEKYRICGKCTKVSEIVIPFGSKELEEESNHELMEKIKCLAERERRTVRRKLDKNGSDVDVNEILNEVNHKLHQKGLLELDKLSTGDNSSFADSDSGNE